jgi:rod shape-determining protein MreD
MRHSYQLTNSRVVISFILAFLIQYLPLVSGVHVSLVMVVLLYWLLNAPKLIGPFTALSIGLLMDLSTGKLFGMLGGIYTNLAFAAIGLKLQYRVSKYPIRMMIASFLIAIYHFIFVLTMYFLYQQYFCINVIYSALADIIAWNIVYFIMQRMGNLYATSWAVN